MALLPLNARDLDARETILALLLNVSDSDTRITLLLLLKLRCFDARGLIS